MKYKALALDLDGTLTDGNKELPIKNKEAVFRAIDEGIVVILASGRPLFGVEPVAHELELSERGGYILACNGGNIVNCSTGEMLRNIVMPRECIADICRLARDNGVYAVTYSGDRIVAESDDDEYVLREAKCNYTTVIKVDSLADYVDYDVPKFLVVGEHHKLLPVQEALLDKYGSIIDAFFSEDYFLEIVPENVSKDLSLDILLRLLNIRKEELIACGDGMNDIPMLRIAGLAAAMDNAYPEVKEYADYIAPSNDECGVADVIEKFILN